MKYSTLFMAIPLPLLAIANAYFVINDMYLCHAFVLVVWSFCCLAVGIDLAENRSV